jgi:hypothetical protein
MAREMKRMDIQDRLREMEKNPVERERVCREIEAAQTRLRPPEIILPPGMERPRPELRMYRAIKRYLID